MGQKNTHCDKNLSKICQNVTFLTIATSSIMIFISHNHCRISGYFQIVRIGLSMKFCKINIINETFGKLLIATKICHNLSIIRRKKSHFCHNLSIICQNVSLTFATSPIMVFILHNGLSNFRVFSNGYTI